MRRSLCSARPPRSLLFALALAGPSAGCADPEGTGPGGASPDTLEIQVIDPGSMSGVEGMPVALDLVDGERLEVATDATGRVSVALELDALVAAIAHRDGWSISAASRGAVTRDGDGDGQLVLFCWSLVELREGEGGVPVSGAILGAASASSHIALSRPGGGLVFDGLASQPYSMTVPAGEPFTVVGLDWSINSEGARIIDETHHGYVVVEHAAVTGPTTLDIDFSAPATTSVVSGSVTPPAHPGIAGNARLNVIVATGDSLEASAWLGFAFSTQPGSDDSSYTFSADHVTLPGAPVVTHFELYAEGIGDSMVLHPGLPIDGVNDIGFLAPPHRTAPADAGPVPWSTPLEWSLEEGSPGVVVVGYHTQGTQVGLAAIGPEERSFALPRLPSSSTVLFSTPVKASVSLCENTDGDIACEKSAQEDGVVLESPF